MHRLTLFLLVPFCLLADRLLAEPKPKAGTPKSEPHKLEFNRDIRPILSDRCFACHGPDQSKRAAGLRLDTFEGATQKRGKTQPIAPGIPAQSRILARITEPKDALRMPPPAKGERLSDKEIDTLKRWIEQGAEYQQHWAYIPPQRPAIPQVSNNAWKRNEIDAFILARLDQEGLKPSPEADRATLLRRLSFDLTGLPPTPAETDAFLKDKSPDAYEKQVDRLLASPRYGERMAMLWLDLARYADTHGYHIDSHRDMWPWRDWVIQAFNSNKPFHQFVIEQLAGDQLPSPTRDQLIATGFNRNHMINFEGGAIPEEYLVEYVADRVETTSTVFLGMTMGCARCHDHKYDPIKQSDFYRMFAFYNTVPELGLDGRAGNAKPLLPLSTPEQDAELQRLNSEIQKLEAEMPNDSIRCAMDEWEAFRAPTTPISRTGLTGHFELDGHLADTSGAYLKGVAKGPQTTYSDSLVGKQLSLNGDTQIDFPSALSLDAKKPFSLALFFRSVVATEGSLLQKIEDAQSRRGLEIIFEKSRALPDLKRGAPIHIRLTSSWPDNTLIVKTRRAITFIQDHHLALTYDGSSQASGLRLFLDGQPEPLDIVKNSLSGDIATNAPLSIANPNLSLPPYSGSIDDLRLYNRTLSDKEVEWLAIYAPVEALLEISRDKRNNNQFEYLKRHFLTREGPALWRDRQTRLTALREQKRNLERVIPTVMIMSDMDKPRDSFVLARGDYRNQKEKVEPGVPSFLTQLPDSDRRPTRLSLAYWITDRNNPLTSRVAVNRFWATLFGTGIVKTLEDFGSQGDTPSHQELLDWLAVDFVNSGWDVKRLIRQMVTSAAYRQSSKATPALIERDPQNRLLARGPRFRLPAEMLRDNALSISGLLKEKQGGPSVRSYQPPNIWEELAFGGEYSAQTYEQDHGDALYRRSMYLFAKRTAPHPELVTFDAPDREKCTPRRLTTNTPLQALVLLNDTTFLEAARALATRMLTEPDTRDNLQRITYGFKLATARTPTKKESQILTDLARQLESKYNADAPAADKLLAIGESPLPANVKRTQLAAWTMLASAILNLDETITKE